MNPSTNQTSASEAQPQLFVRSIGNTAGSYSILTLNIHRTAQWDHDLMIDARFFESLSLGDVLEVRKVETRSSTSAFSSAPLRKGSFAYAYSDSDSEESDDSSFGVPTELNPVNPSHPLLFSPSSQRSLLHSGMDSTLEDDDNVLLLEVTTLSQPLGRVQISIKEKISKQFGFQLFSPVRVSKLSPTTAAKFEAAFVEITFSGRYLSNGDLWLVRSALKGKPVYIGKTIKVMGVMMTVENIHHISPEGGVDEKRQAKFGIVSRRTRFVFRSGSAQVYWLIQCSVEMWGFVDDGDLMHERLFSRFVPSILDRWNACNAKHCLTVVFFTRTVFNGEPPTGVNSMPLNRFPNPDDSRRYVDFYHVVLSNETRSDWRTLLGPLQDAFHDFPKRANWASKVSSAPATKSTFSSNVCGLPSIAQEGNVLEAINLSLNVMQNQHTDRDLLRSGQLMVLMTGGSGVFEVDARLARMTKDRMTNHAIGLDIISLTQPPVHVVPLFIHNPSSSYSAQEEVLNFDQSHPFHDPSGDHSSSSRQRHQQDDSASAESSFSESPPVFPSSTGSFGSHYRGFDTSPSGGGGKARSPPGTGHHRRHRPSKTPVFNIPYWINLAFPFHRPTKEFQPIFENRMFSIPDPQRSTFPSALLAPLERVSMNAPMDLELTAPAAVWGTNRRIPLRDEMQPWFPLVKDILEKPLSKSGSMGNVREVTSIETKRISSPVKRSATTANLTRSASMAQVQPTQQGMTRSTSTSGPSMPHGFQIAQAPPPPGTNAALSGGFSTLAHSQQQQQQQPLVPSPSLAALQSFSGLGLDRTGAQHVPKVSWIPQESSGFSLPPSSTSLASSLKPRTISMAAEMNRSFQSTSMSTTTTTPMSQSLAQFPGGPPTAVDIAAIRAKQKKHDDHVFSPPHLHQQQTQKKRSPTLPVMLSPGGLISGAPSLPIKQSVNDLATLAMTPSMNHKARMLAQSQKHLHHQQHPTSETKALISRTRRGASETETQLGVSQSSSFGTNAGGASSLSMGGSLSSKPLRLERSTSLNITPRSRRVIEEDEEEESLPRKVDLEENRLDEEDERENDNSGEEYDLGEADTSPASRASSSSSLSSFTVNSQLPPSASYPRIPSTSLVGVGKITAMSSSSMSLSNISVGSGYAPSQYVNPFLVESLMKWYCERPSHSRSRWLHLFPNSRLDGLRYIDFDEAEESELGDEIGGGVTSGGDVPFADNGRGFLSRGRRDTIMTAGGEDVEPSGATRENPSPSIVHIPSSSDVLFSEEDPQQATQSQQQSQQQVKGRDVNWKSLQTPAILPLTTGFAPTSDALAQSYSIGTYSLVGSNMDQVLQDVICQRLAEDFQIYDPEDFQEHITMVGTGLSSSPRPEENAQGDVIYSSPSKTPQSQQQQQPQQQHPFLKGMGGSLDKENYILTIGHRVHVLSYSRSLKKLDITLFGREHHHHFSSNNKEEQSQQNQDEVSVGSPSPQQPQQQRKRSATGSSAALSGTAGEYKYLLWDADFGDVRPVSRSFVDDSSAEYSWNYVDNLLTGDEFMDFQYNTEFSVSFKSLRFRLFDALSVRRLLEVVGEKLQQAGHFSSPSLPRSNTGGSSGGWSLLSFVRFLGGGGGGGIETRKEIAIGNETVDQMQRSVLDYQIRLGPTFELDFDLGGTKEGSEPSTVHNEAVNSKTGNTFNKMMVTREREWIYLNLDSHFHPERAFHFELRWIVASGESVFRLVEDCLSHVIATSNSSSSSSTTSAATAEAPIEPPNRGGRIVQVASYCVSSQDPHPFLVPRRVVMERRPEATHPLGSPQSLLRECCDVLIRKAKLFVLDSKEEENQTIASNKRSHDDPTVPTSLASTPPRNIKTVVLSRMTDSLDDVRLGSVFCRLTPFETTRSGGHLTPSDASAREMIPAVVLEFICNPYTPACSDLAVLADRVKAELATQCGLRVRQDL